MVICRRCKQEIFTGVIGQNDICWGCHKIENNPTALLQTGNYDPTKDPTVHAVKVAAVCSVPRLGWQDHFGSIFRALSPHNMVLSWFTTAFWHKGISQAMKREILADWILVTDYDTVFDYHHISQLLSVFGNNPHMDALAAMQPRRGNGAPLMTAKDGDGNKLKESPANGPIKAYTAHFGCTLIRTSALRDLPKPWFLGVPDENLEWGDLCVDPDIYFWKKWAECGKTLYVDPRIRVGHLEVMVSHMDEHMIQRYVPVSQWRAMHSDEGSQALETTETKG
jgi:hypothetical protein